MQSFCTVRDAILWTLMRSVWRLKQRQTDSPGPTRASLPSPSTCVSTPLMVTQMLTQNDCKGLFVFKFFNPFWLISSSCLSSSPLSAEPDFDRPARDDQSGCRWPASGHRASDQRHATAVHHQGELPDPGCHPSQHRPGQLWCSQDS